MDLTCTKIRQADGTPLTVLQVWELIEELSTAASAPDDSEALFFHLEMAYRNAEAQGHRSFIDAVTRWMNTATKPDPYQK